MVCHKLTQDDTPNTLTGGSDGSRGDVSVATAEKRGWLELWLTNGFPSDYDDLHTAEGFVTYMAGFSSDEEGEDGRSGESEAYTASDCMSAFFIWNKSGETWEAACKVGRGKARQELKEGEIFPIP